jgi:hypothetical protein
MKGVRARCQVLAYGLFKVAGTLRLGLSKLVLFSRAGAWVGHYESYRIRSPSLLAIRSPNKLLPDANQVFLRCGYTLNAIF